VNARTLPKRGGKASAPFRSLAAHNVFHARHAAPAALVIPANSSPAVHQREASAKRPHVLQIHKNLAAGLVAGIYDSRGPAGKVQDRNHVGRSTGKHFAQKGEGARRFNFIAWICGTRARHDRRIAQIDDLEWMQVAHNDIRPQPPIAFTCGKACDMMAPFGQVLGELIRINARASAADAPAENQAVQCGTASLMNRLGKERQNAKIRCRLAMSSSAVIHTGWSNKVAKPVFFRVVR
jgi:hypothetical protein